MRRGQVIACEGCFDVLAALVAGAWRLGRGMGRLGRLKQTDVQCKPQVICAVLDVFSKKTPCLYRIRTDEPLGVRLAPVAAGARAQALLALLVLEADLGVGVGGVGAGDLARVGGRGLGAPVVVGAGPEALVRAGRAGGDLEGGDGGRGG